MVNVRCADVQDYERLSEDVLPQTPELDFIARRQCLANALFVPHRRRCLAHCPICLIANGAMVMPLRWLESQACGQRAMYRPLKL